MILFLEQSSSVSSDSLITDEIVDKLQNLPENSWVCMSSRDALWLVLLFSLKAHQTFKARTQFSWSI